MINYSNPFLQSLGNIRTLPQQNQFTQPQNQFNQPQNQYDFSGWGDRLGKIEEGIAGLTKQFNSFQKPGDVAPENTGNAAPEPLEQSANAPEPLGGIESLVAPQDTGFNFDPQGGSLMSQLSSAYGQPTTAWEMAQQPGYTGHQPGRGGMAFTQGFQNFVQDAGYHVDNRPMAYDAGPSISETPIPIGLGGRMQGQQVHEGYNDQFNPVNKPTSQQGRPHTGIPVPNQEWSAGLGPLRPNDIANISEVTRPGIQDKTWSPTPGWRPEQGTPPPGWTPGAKQDDMNFDFQGYPERPNDLMQPIGGPTREQQYQQLMVQSQALQGGLGALQGPTQQKIKQGYQV